MTKQQKITLSASRDIPFNKLMLSQSNVRHVKAGVSIEELAEDIARRTLLSSITVRPVLDDSGAETGMYTIPAGGRRFRALELLVKQKRMNKTALVPCIVRTDGLAEEDSLAENVQRAPLHPLDQFRAFQSMRDKGRTEEEIAAAFFVSASVVKQRLKLAAVAPSLHDAYAEEEMTLDQLMAFTVNPDHARQVQVWEALQRHYSRQPYEIRRMLTEGAVRASDKRAQFVGLDDYVEAGGEILRDLFQQDDGGWLQDAALLDVMVHEKLAEEAEAVRAEGWKWVEVDTEFPYGHSFGMRRIHGEAVPMTCEEAARYQALKAEYDALEAEHTEADELPEDVDARLGEIEETMEAFEARPIRYEADDLALAGAFVSIDSSGRLRVERGYVRPEDEPVEEVEDIGEVAPEAVPVEDSDDTVTSTTDDEEEDDGLKPLSDRLVMELTAHRTLALRNALAQDPQVAFLAALHAMVLRLFYRYAVDSCVEIEPRNAGFGSQVPGLGEARDSGLRTSRLMAATPYQILTFIGRGTSARDYHRLKAALDRLQSTTVCTSIRQPAEGRRHRFSWINEWTERTDASGRPDGIELIVPDWFYRAVLDDALILTIDRAYFELTGGLDRWLYRLVRKHGGRQRAGWRFEFRHLHVKSGSLSPFKRFAFELREIIRRQPLPGYRLALEIEARGRRLLAFEPCGQAVEGLVLSGTPSVVPSGTGPSCYREPEPGASSSSTGRIRARNFESNKESNSCCAPLAGGKPADARFQPLETGPCEDVPELPLGVPRGAKT